MEGKNELHFCPAEMKKAVQYYLKHVVFSGPYGAGLKVTSVTKLNEGFDIGLEEVVPGPASPPVPKVQQVG